MTLNEKFQTFKKNSSNIPQSFDKMAEYIFNNCYLEANGKKYYLTEIEFYYYHKIEHPDLWCYRKPEKNGMFPSDSLWFHYSGMDITFDNRKNNESGGILIRSIKDEKGNPTNGPLRSLYALLNTNSNDKSVCLKLISSESKEKISINKTTRYGLNVQIGDKNFSEKNKYQAREYRFYLEGTDIKENK